MENLIKMTSRAKAASYSSRLTRNECSTLRCKFPILSFSCKLTILLCSRKPKSRHIIPTYVIPTDKKRESVRHHIRMKMLMSNGMDFPNSSVNKPTKKYLSAAQRKITKKVTQQPVSAIYTHMKLV